jgi:hypothetical protein
MTGASEAIRTYILAKDGNRPWLMGRAFAENARLEMLVETDAISFPSTATGVGAITDVLVRGFARDYENVYTLCLSSPPGSGSRQFDCDDAMQVLAPEYLMQIMGWLSELPYPWCPASAAAEKMPVLDGLGPVSDFFHRRV